MSERAYLQQSAPRRPPPRFQPSSSSSSREPSNDIVDNGTSGIPEANRAPIPTFMRNVGWPQWCYVVNVFNEF